MEVQEINHREADSILSTPDVDAVVQALQKLAAAFVPNGQSEIRDAIVKTLDQLGWSGEVKVSPELNITVTSVKGRVAACVQFGNISRAYADLLKVQALYERDGCDGALFVVPSKEAATKMASNLTNSDRLRKELKFFRSIINIPIRILSVSGGK